MAIKGNGAAGQPLAGIETIMALPEFAPLLGFTSDQLMQELQRRNVKGFTLARAVNLIPTKLLTAHSREIARTIANFVNPQGQGACTAGRARIAHDAHTSIKTVDRFTASDIGKAMFTNVRPDDADRYDTSTRQLTPEFMLYVLALDMFKRTASKTIKQVQSFALQAATALLSGLFQGRQNVSPERRQNVPQKNKKISFKRSKKKSIPLVAKLKKLAGGDKTPTAAELKAQQEQNRIRGKNFAAERAYHERQQVDRKSEGRIMAMVRGMMNKGRDVNAISEPDTDIPPGWRGAQGEPRAAAPAPVMPRLTPLELAQIERAYHCIAAHMPRALADKARAAGITLR